MEDMLTRVQGWLAPTDSQSKLRASLKLRTASTGKWYLQSAQYEAWKAGAIPFIWLHGLAGSGKTILSAGIINDLQEVCKNDPTKSLAFFFFDFNDAEKRDPTDMVKSLLSQVLHRCTIVPDAVRSLHATYESGRREAPVDQLLRALRETLELLSTPLIVLHALDECSSWNALFDIVLEMQGWGESVLSVLFTSRKEVMIEEALEDIVPQDHRSCLENRWVDKDIRTYIKERITKDKSFKRWHRDLETQKEIERTLGLKAGGMYSLPNSHTLSRLVLTIIRRFRWAACQLDTLARCLTRGRVRRALEEIPKTLDETYARTLCVIDESEYAEEALEILTWLTYAERPLTTTEVLQVTGILMDDELHFDEDEVLEEPVDILRICSSLVSIVADTKDSTGDSDDDVTNDEGFHSDTNPKSDLTYVRLAHFSVKEYLVSGRPCIARYRLQDQEPHDMLAKCCLVYLFRFHEDEWRSPDCETVFPLARYAASFWTQHARASG
jgi:hypothetical protein